MSFLPVDGPLAVHLVGHVETVLLTAYACVVADATTSARSGVRGVERDADVPLDRLVERFAELRAESLTGLDALITEPADLDRRGLHPSLGVVTLRELLATWAVHDLDHIAQIFAGMAASYDAEVGPWKAYLGILLRRDDPAAVPD